MAYNLAQKILNDDKTVITNMSSVLSNIDTLSICNIHTADISVDLYVASQVTTDVTDTGSQVNFVAGYAATTSSQAIVIENSGIAATSDMFLNERVYKDDGTFISTCTTFTDENNITFSSGLEVALVNDGDLYTGTRYYILKGVNVPANTTLVLEQNELRVDPDTYIMYIKSSNASGNIDVIIRK
jgi:hypothetical protein